MSSGDRNVDAVQTLVLSAERMRGLLFCSDTVERLLNLSSLVILRHRLGPKRSPLVGLIGCTGTGKSTLFNSLAGQAISATGWKAHNTCGPVLLISSSFLSELEDVERQLGILLLPSFEREIVEEENPAITAGAPGSMYLIFSTSKDREEPIFLDLPDINTTLAREENNLALVLLPWMDTVIFMVDDETVYHRDYEAPVVLSKQLQQARICILNNRGRDRVELDHPDLQETKRFFDVDAIHVLPQIQEADRFEKEPEFARFKDSLKTSVRRARSKPLLELISTLARPVVEENTHRCKTLESLENDVSAAIRETLSHESPISLEKILHDDVLMVLSHLGLKRFAISNIYSFFRRIATTGSLRRSFQISFGSQREEFLSRILQLDGQKLVAEVSQRLSDHYEKISCVVRRNKSVDSLYKMVSELRSISFFTASDNLSDSLQDLVERFERQCREVIVSDSITASVKNDPLVAVSLILALIADVFTLPGFGSWILVPSAFQYLPLGKFEKIKRQFQQEVQEIISQQLHGAMGRLREIRSRILLEESDPLLAALIKCAGYKQS